MEDYNDDFDANDLSESELIEYTEEYKKFLSEDCEDYSSINLDILEAVIFHLIEESDSELALRFATLWLNIEPDSPEAWYAIGVVYSSYSDYKEATLCYDKALELDPLDTDIIVQKAINYSMEGNNSLAISVLDEILENDPQNELALYNKAYILQYTYRYVEAINILEKLIEMECSEYPLFDDIAFCYQSIKKYNKAIYYFRKALDENPDDAIIWYNLGMVHSHAGHKFQAIEALKTSIAIEHTMPNPHFLLGEIYAEMGRLSMAIEEFTWAYDIDPNNLEYASNLALVLADSGNFESAINIFTLIIDKYSTVLDTAVPYYARCFCYEAMEKYEEAITDIEKAINIDPINADYFYAYGNLLGRVEKYDRAIYAFKRSIQLNPDKIPAKMDLAVIYMGLKKNAEARELLDSILENNPTHTAAVHLMAKSYLMESDFDSAAKYLFDLLNVDNDFKKKVQAENPEFYAELEQKSEKANNKLKSKKMNKS